MADMAQAGEARQGAPSGPGATLAPPKARELGSINTVGLYTLYRKEVQRFMKVYMQTVAAPVVTTLLFYTVFSLAIGSIVQRAGDVPFLQFLGPGLIMMSMLQNAFQNTSSSVMIAKMQGNIVDVLMSPLRPIELAVAYIAGGATRGLLVGAVSYITISLIVPLPMHNLGWVLFHGAGACLLLSMIGLIAGIWADKFDHIAAVTNFIITPAAFLSGTFYTIERLPEPVQVVAHFNPVFYMIDGFRNGFIGHHDSVLWVGFLMVAGANIALFWACHRILVSGWKLKS